MKKIMLFVAMALILAVAAPVMAGPYSDVPETHWAYQALEKLAPTGIMGGYPDGTFQGNNTLNRFQVAVIVAKVLDQVAAERALLAEKVDALENGLTAGQAEDVIAIFKSLLAKAETAKVETPAPAPVTTPAPAQPVVEVQVPENLTATQAEEVAAIVEALALEFKFELEAMGAKIEALGPQFAELNAKVAAVEGKVAGLDGRFANIDGQITDLGNRVATLEKKPVTWSGKYGVAIDRTIIEGNAGMAYLNPFDFDLEDDDEEDLFADANVVKQTLGLTMNAKTANLNATMNINTMTDNFEAVPTWSLKNISGVISGEGFSATVKRSQANVMTSYLFGKNDPDADLYNGIKLTVNKDIYVLFHDADKKNIFATQKSLSFLNSTLYVGVKDIVNDDKFIAGISTPFDVLGIDLTTQAAVEKTVDEATEDVFAKFFTINAKKTVGPLAVEGNYTLKDKDFAGYYAKSVKSAGYDAKGTLTLLGGNLTANGRYKDYAHTQYGFGTDVKMGILSANFDMDMASKDVEGVVTESDRLQYGAKIATDIAFLNVSAGYKFDKVTDGIGGIYKDADGVALKDFNRVYGDLKAKLFGGLSATANYVYGLDYMENADKDNTGLTTHKYGLNFTKGIFVANAKYNVVKSTINTDATIDPAAINVLGLGIDTVAGFAMEKPKAVDAAFNYNVGVDVTKALNAKSNLTYGFVYDKRDIATGDQNGLEKKHSVTVDYSLTKDLKVAVNYVDLDFEGVVAGEVDPSYRAKSLTSSLSLSF